jgi:hypothetical protein
MGKIWVWWYMPIIPAMEGNVKEDHGPGWLGKNVRPYLQNNHSKSVGDVTQAVECLQGKCQDLSSNPCNNHKKKKKKL